MPRKITLEIITILFIILWIYAGLNKLLDFEKFRFQLGRSPYIQSLAGLVAWLLPAGEMVMALMLVIKRTRLLGLYLSFFTMCLFTGYIYVMLHYSYFIPCSCGGILSKMDWHTHLVFNIVFIFFAATGVIIYVPENDSDLTSSPAFKVTLPIRG
jgi:uncharacterized membrane protein YphA (DoxX/SURF4 family)